MAEVASAYVSLLPSARGFGSKLESQVGGSLKKSGARMGAFLGTSLKAGAVGVAAAAGGIIGTALFKGFSRLDAIDQAKAKLLGLGNSAKTVDKIMSNALKSVKGTAFGLDEAATTAASAVAAGIKPGKELTGVLKTVADTATIAGASMADTGAIFGSVAARGKLQGDDLMQLQSRGVPVLAMLAKHYGITAAAASEMVTKGEVDFKNFASAMHEGLGGAALQSGKTFKGAMANMLASLGRIGANLLSGIFPQLKSGIGGITDILSSIEPVAARVGKKIGDALSNVADAVGPLAQNIGPKLAPLADALGNIAKITWGKLQSGIDALKKLTNLDFSKIDAKGLGEAIGTAVADVLNTLGSLAAKVTGKLSDALSKVDWVGIGIAMGRQAPALLLGLAAGILNFDVGGLMRGIGDHWLEILLGVLSIAFAPAKIAGKLGELLTKIPFVGKFLAQGVLWVNELGGKLLGFGADLLRYFWRGFTETPIPGAGFVSKVLAALKGLPGKVGDFLSLLRTRIGVWALDAFQAMGRGARSGVSSVVSFMGSVPGRILSALGSLARLLAPRGVQAIEGLVSGLRSRLGQVTSVLKSIPGKVKSALSGAGSWLIETGKNIVRGLISGIGALKGAVTSALLNLIPGPLRKFAGKLGIHSPSRVFHGFGVNIVEGLVNGIKDKKSDVAKSLADLAKAIHSGSADKLTTALDGFRDHIKDLPKAVRGPLRELTATFSKALDGLTTKLGTKADELKSLKDQFTSLSSGISQAFVPSDLFSSATLADLKGALTLASANLGSATLAQQQLTKAGVNKDFVTQLLNSGNAALLSQLAEQPDVARDLGAQYAALVKGANTLGDSQATAVLGSKIQQTNSELKQIKAQQKQLPAQIAKELTAALRGHAAKVQHAADNTPKGRV